ncbi:hypothetical protein, partial [Paenibacillus sp. YK5]
MNKLQTPSLLHLQVDCYKFRHVLCQNLLKPKELFKINTPDTLETYEQTLYEPLQSGLSTV